MAKASIYSAAFGCSDFIKIRNFTLFLILFLWNTVDKKVLPDSSNNSAQIAKSTCDTGH